MRDAFVLHIDFWPSWTRRWTLMERPPAPAGTDLPHLETRPLGRWNALEKPSYLEFGIRWAQRGLQVPCGKQKQQLQESMRVSISTFKL